MAITIPVSADNAPRKRYSNAVMAKICLRLPPKVRSKTLSCIRWYLLMRTDDINTMMPVDDAKTGHEFDNIAYFASRSSNTLSTSPKSIMDTLGYCLTTACWYFAETVFDGTCVSNTWICGASSNDPVGNTTWKLVEYCSSLPCGCC